MSAWILKTNMSRAKFCGIILSMLYEGEKTTFTLWKSKNTLLELSNH